MVGSRSAAFSSYSLSLPPINSALPWYPTLCLSWEEDRILALKRDTVHTPETDDQKYSDQKRKGTTIQRGLINLLGWLFHSFYRLFLVATPISS